MEDKGAGGPGGGAITDSALDEVDEGEEAWEAVPVPPCVVVMAESGGDAPGVASMGDSGVEGAGWGADTGADSAVDLGGGGFMGDKVGAAEARPGDGAIGDSGFDPLPEGRPPPCPPDPPGALPVPEPPVPFGMTLTLPIKDFAGYSSPRFAARAGCGRRANPGAMLNALRCDTLLSGADPTGTGVDV